MIKFELLTQPATALTDEQIDRLLAYTTVERMVRPALCIFSSWPRRRPPKQVDFYHKGRASRDADRCITDDFNGDANPQLAWVAAFAAMTSVALTTDQSKGSLVYQVSGGRELLRHCTCRRARLDRAWTGAACFWRFASGTGRVWALAGEDRRCAFVRRVWYEAASVHA